MTRAILLGSGNVAVHLARALGAAEGISLVQRYARGNSNAELFDPSVPLTSDLGALLEAEIYIIAIKDDQIPAFAENLASFHGLVVHTSGSVAMQQLGPVRRKGVLYPIQSFSARRALDFTGVPVAIEAEKPEDLALLKAFASTISDRVYELASAQRKMLHLAAVFANNFSNHMFAQAEKICAENDISFKLLGPLMEETVDKALDMGPKEAQTGPARRDDKAVVHRQMDLLEGDLKILYKTLSDSISSQFNQ